MTEVSIDQFAAAKAGGAFVIDVREPFEYVGGHVPGAELVPLGEVASRTAALPSNQPLYVICASGNRSLRATEYLRAAGFDAYSVSGGTSGWIGAGKPVVTGPDADA
ncbi:rhodanese-like domain-containing protein [Georgenia thermotolerans]|uniref:Rhodanese-like domain-containing protein n=1 Tax=Georgenia thermotolerans TaxID=527326 RepID=A0A7J5UP82_9MICO|nr:rhodanese-like domain-containing protein [Georgenia thermotolerans]KAE8764216.1 rhodanese-like domain-containing protein [Georgenia thermotolerans]